MNSPLLSRRALLSAGAATSLISLVPLRAYAAPDDMQAAIRDYFGDKPIEEGKVSFKAPPIAENGFSVSISIDVDSPMTDNDHVRRIGLFAPKNPLPDIGRFELSPAAGRARVATRIRLSDSQTLLAIAETSDGKLWSGAAETIVTLAACVII